MFFEIPTVKSPDTSCVYMCQSSVHPAFQRQERNFQICQCVFRGHRFSRSREDPVFAKFCRRHPWKRVAFALTIQIILISTFKSLHSQFFWKFPFPTLPYQFCKSCTKNPGVFIAMWLRPGQPYTQIPVPPHTGPMTLSKLLNISDPQFLLFLKRDNHNTLFLSGEN